ARFAGSSRTGASAAAASSTWPRPWRPTMALESTSSATNVMTAPEREEVGDAPVLACRSISVSFGGVQALKDVSIAVQRESIVGLLGPNAEGKTTLVNAVSGLKRPQSGSVVLRGRDVTSASPLARARSGLARTFQQPRLF